MMDMSSRPNIVTGLIILLALLDWAMEVTVVIRWWGDSYRDQPLIYGMFRKGSPSTDTTLGDPTAVSGLWMQDCLIRVFESNTDNPKRGSEFVQDLIGQTTGLNISVATLNEIRPADSTSITHLVRHVTMCAGDIPYFSTTFRGYTVEEVCPRGADIFQPEKYLGSLPIGFVASASVASPFGCIVGINGGGCVVAPSPVDHDLQFQNTFMFNEIDDHTSSAPAMAYEGQENWHTDHELAGELFDHMMRIRWKYKSFYGGGGVMDSFHYQILDDESRPYVRDCNLCDECAALVVSGTVFLAAYMISAFILLVVNKRYAPYFLPAFSSKPRKLFYALVEIPLSFTGIHTFTTLRVRRPGSWVKGLICRLVLLNLPLFIMKLIYVSWIRNVAGPGPLAKRGQVIASIVLNIPMMAYSCYGIWWFYWGSPPSITTQSTSVEMSVNLTALRETVEQERAALEKQFKSLRQRLGEKEGLITQLEQLATARGKPKQT